MNHVTCRVQESSTFKTRIRLNQTIMTSTQYLFPNTSRARLQALYSDFSRQKHSNPSAYHANVEWWRATLETIVSCGSPQETDTTPSRLTVQADQSLLDKLKVEKVGKPLALGAVIVGYYCFILNVPLR